MNKEFLEALEAVAKEKKISQEMILETLDDALVSAYKKNFGTSQNVKVVTDRKNGEIKVFALKEVSEVVENPFLHIALDEARAIDKRYELGDIVQVSVIPKDFGRIAAQTAKQVVVQRIREAERGQVFDEFSDKENELVTGIVQQKDKGNIIIDLGSTEAVLTMNEQAKGEEYEVHDRIKCYIIEVKNTNKGPQVVVSRTHPGLVKRLFELEVPEITEGVIEIKSISREAGSRTKMAVRAFDENVDAVGACVGQKGQRVQYVVDELKGEKIDIIEWSEEMAKFVGAALSPAKVIDVTYDETENIARVIVEDNQLSLAIGKEGQNARLAAKLTGCKIDIKSALTTR